MLYLPELEVNKRMKANFESLIYIKFLCVATLTKCHTISFNRKVFL